MKRIYQWLSQRASFFHSQTSGRGTSGTSRTIRTEVTVERQGMTLLVGGAAPGLDICPFCGQKLAAAQTEQTKVRLQEGSISQGSVPVDVPPP